MRFISVRELRGKSALIWQELTEEKDMVVTSNGKPIAILSNTSEDTLEESIAAMIDRKRKLMTSVVQADHPQLTKIFTRDELFELLRDLD